MDCFQSKTGHLATIPNDFPTYLDRFCWEAHPYSISHLSSSGFLHHFAAVCCADSSKPAHRHLQRSAQKWRTLGFSTGILQHDEGNISQHNITVVGEKQVHSSTASSSVHESSPFALERRAVTGSNAVVSWWKAGSWGRTFFIRLMICLRSSMNTRCLCSFTIAVKNFLAMTELNQYYMENEINSECIGFENGEQLKKCRNARGCRLMGRGRGGQVRCSVQIINKRFGKINNLR